MEGQVLEIWKMYIRQPELWDGWDHSSTPVGFHDDTVAVLFGHPCPPSEFEEREAEGIRYHTDLPKPVSFTANTSIELNGFPTAMKYPVNDAGVRALGETEARLLSRAAAGPDSGQTVIGALVAEEFLE